jgi:hypothetical protein
MPLMLRNRYVIAGAILAVLLVANILNWIFSGWGLITVTVTNAPLGQVIKSIERQGWVTVYSDLDPSTPVSMYVVKVPLAEAMETLTANLGGTDDSGKRLPSADWHLGFFAAPTSAGVKQEIHAFQAGTLDDDAKIYSFGTPLQMLATPDTDMPAADPRLQTWPGYKAPPAPPTPAANDASNGQPADAPAAPQPPTNVQDYFHALAEQSDIMIVAPGSWAPNVPAPPPSSSIIHAVKKLVGTAHGSVEEAIVLRSRERREGGGGGGRGFAGGDTGWSYMQDRMENAIRGLPPEARPDATAQLQQEAKFHQDLEAAPPDQRRDLMRKHFMGKMGQNNWRRSPQKRAQMYARAVSNRQSARGQ